MPYQGMGFETGLRHGIGNESTSRQNEIELAPKKRSEPRPGSATPATEEKLKLGKLKAEIRKTENWKPASEGKNGLEKTSHETTNKAAKPPL